MTRQPAVYTPTADLGLAFEGTKPYADQSVITVFPAMAIAGDAIFKLADLCVDASLDEIRKDGVSIMLEPRTMRLLVALAARAGQVVSVQELLDLVWKDVVVSPDSVYRPVASLRRALGDDAKEPRYIANVMRRRYRLVAPVSRVRWHWGILVVAAAFAIGYPIVEKLRQFTHVGAAGFETTAAAVGIRERSVAVLPFVNMSDQKDQEYFADGLTKVLIDRLAMVPEVAKALGVAHLLEGGPKVGSHAADYRTTRPCR